MMKVFPEGMRKVIRTTLLFGVGLTVLAVALLYQYVSAEGYPTIEAMRNRLLSDGKIVIGLPADFSSVTSVSCDLASDDDIDVHADKVIVHIGYTWCTTHIRGTTADGREAVIVVNSQKLNNWNTIRYVPLPSSSNHWAWAKYENGVKQEHSDIVTEYRSDDARRNEIAIVKSNRLTSGSTRTNEFVLFIGDNEQLYVNDVPVVEAELVDHIDTLSASGSAMLIRAYPETKHRTVKRIMDLASSRGVSEIYFMAVKREGDSMPSRSDR